MIPKLREWDAVRAEMYGMEYGMAYAEREDLDDSINFRFSHIEDMDLMNKDGTIDRIVMCSTGITDVKGVDIFEGDIVKVTDKDGGEFRCAVQYYADEGYPAFDIEPPYEHYYDANVLSTIDGSDFQDMEVVGNIYQHPELLEAEK